MLSEQLQRILCYFLDEATDDMQQLEMELLHWQGTVLSSDKVNQMIRAVHSIRGGAAMLGLNTIQRTAHRLEECFKLLRECPVTVDSKLDALVCQIAQKLQHLLTMVSRSSGLDHHAANLLMLQIDPLFTELTSHLYLIIPMRLRVRVTTDDEYCYTVSGYCLSLISFFQAIGEAVSNLGGSVIRHEQEGGHPRVLIDIQLPAQTSLDAICSAIQSAGGIIGNIQTERLFPLFIRSDFFSSKFVPERPIICRGCRYYYGHNDGGNMLVCAIHPYGPEENTCPDYER